jgi:hypothetical protein
MKTLRTFMISRSILLRMRDILDKFVQKIETHFMFNNIFFRILSLLCDNVEKYGIARQARGDNIIRRKRFACWKLKLQTHTQNT